MSDKKSAPKFGPYACENWKAAERGDPCTSTLEYPMFTDALVASPAVSRPGRRPCSPSSEALIRPVRGYTTYMALYPHREMGCSRSL